MTKLSRHTIEVYAYLVLLIGAFCLAFFVAQPYLNALLVASVAAIIFDPLYQSIRKILRGKASLVSLLTILVITILILGPISLIGSQVFFESRTLYLQLEGQGGGNTILMQVKSALTARLGDSFDPEIIDQLLKNILQFFSSQAGNIISSVLRTVVKVAIGIFALYYFLKDSGDIRRYVLKISPLTELHTAKIMDNLRLTIQATIRGSIIVAFVQGLLIGLGLLALQVANPFLWGSIGFIAALVPAIGTTLITAPIIIFLFFTGEMTKATVFLIWGIGGVGLADNLIRPYLLGRHTGLHPFPVFISVIGGIGFFGVTGILWGPIILSLLTTTLESYPMIIADTADGK